MGRSGGYNDLLPSRSLRTRGWCGGGVAEVMLLVGEDGKLVVQFELQRGHGHA
jgi:hypothetical protein